MGSAAYNRGSVAISKQIDSDYERAREFYFMDHLNSLPKLPNAPAPFGPVQFVHSHNGWWIECPKTGFGYWYRTLREAVRAFSVDITEYSDGMWKGVPRA